MKRLKPHPLRRSHPRTRPDFDSALFTFVEDHCPQFITTRDSKRHVSARGVLAYLEAVERGKEPGDRQAARDGIHNIKEIIRYRESQNQPT